MNALIPSIDELQAALTAATDRVAFLEQLLAPETELPKEWGLTRTEARLFSVICARDVATREQMLAALYPDRRAPPEPKIIDVLVCKIRQKLRPFSVEIETVWGRGYRMAGAKNA